MLFAFVACNSEEVIIKNTPEIQVPIVPKELKYLALGDATQHR